MDSNRRWCSAAVIRALRRSTTAFTRNDGSAEPFTRQLSTNKTKPQRSPAAQTLGYAPRPSRRMTSTLSGHAAAACKSPSVLRGAKSGENLPLGKFHLNSLQWSRARSPTSSALEYGADRDSLALEGESSLTCPSPAWQVSSGELAVVACSLFHLVCIGICSLSRQSCSRGRIFVDHDVSTFSTSSFRTCG